MNLRKFIFLAMLTLSLCWPEYVLSIPAFPGAEGFGANSVGGRGGQVIKVTNLNDSGPGSLRAGIEAFGPRIVVFEVSGIINLESDLTLLNPYITIAGQTSPGGILVQGRKTLINTHNVIMQHMRFRVGSPVGVDPETLDASNIWGKYWGANDAHDIIIDHCAFSWGVDEVLSISGGVTDTTLQWSIISEGLSNAGHPKGEHSKGLMVSGKYVHDNTVSLHHNYIAHNNDRVPLIYSPSDVDTVVDVVNNVVYHWKGGLSPASEGAAKVNWIHNYVKQGPTSHSYSFEVRHIPSSEPSPQIYVYGNIGSTRLSQSDPHWNVGVSYYNELLDEAWRKLTPWTTPPITTTEMSYNYALKILENVGATKPVRDSVDTRVVADFAAGTGDIIDNVTYPDDFPTFATPAPPTDTDSDGMADAWETTRGLNVGVDDSALDDDSDGYTNMEEYLHYLGGYSGQVSTPGLTSITSSTLNGSYKPGEAIDITVNFSEAVTLAGSNLVVALNTGRTIEIGPFTSRTSVSGTYTVQAADNSDDLNVDSLILSGGTLQNAEGVDCSLSLPTGSNLADNKDIVIGNASPTSSASASPTNGTGPLTVTFTGSGSDTDGYISSYQWDFGDGTSSDDQNPTRTYDNVGSYTATLTVTDNEGAPGTSDPLTISVSEAEITIFSDIESDVPSLNDTTHWTPHSPSRWSVISNEDNYSYAIITSDYSNNGDMLGEYSIFNDFAGNSFTLTLKVKSTEDLQSNTWADYDVIFGYQDDSNYYYVMFNADASANLLFKVVNGTRTEMASYNGALITDNLYYEIEIRRSGESIQVFFDGTEVMSATDNTYETGKIGLGGFNDAANFDDIQIFIPPADVSAFNATPGVGQVSLSWTNPSDSDFAGVMIRYRTDGTNPQNKYDGSPIPNGNDGKIEGSPDQNMSYVHTNLDPETHYYYSAFTYDTSNNYSETAYADAQPLSPSPNNNAPVIQSFTGVPSSLNNPGETITLNAFATDPDGDSLTYTINFGDGTASESGNEVVHTYASAGTYTADVTVDDGHGNTVGESLQIAVNDVPPAKPTGVTVK